MKMTPILTITGSDSTGGAGIQADIRTITGLGGEAMSVVTSITLQNSLGSPRPRRCQGRRHSRTCHRTSD